MVETFHRNVSTKFIAVLTALAVAIAPQTPRKITIAHHLAVRHLFQQYLISELLRATQINDDIKSKVID